MSEFDDYSSIELLKLSNDAKSMIDKLKNDVIDKILQVDKLQIEINQLINQIDEYNRVNNMIIIELNRR